MKQKTKLIGIQKPHKVETEHLCVYCKNKTKWRVNCISHPVCMACINKYYEW